MIEDVSVCLCVRERERKREREGEGGGRVSRHMCLWVFTLASESIFTIGFFFTNNAICRNNEFKFTAQLWVIIRSMLVVAHRSLPMS